MTLQEKEEEEKKKSTRKDAVYWVLPLSIFLNSIMIGNCFGKISQLK